MMTDAPTGHFQSIVLQPHAGQFVIDELPAIVLCCAAWVYGGMEGLPLTALAVSVRKRKWIFGDNCRQYQQRKRSRS